jgi:hypothetical protein
MRDPTRTVLVVTDRPHAWALLRDRLDPALADVAWTLPASLERTAGDALPWAVAGDVGTLPESAWAPMRGRLVAVHWVGQPPPGTPTRPRLHADWADLAAALLRSTQASIGGLRLAPANGLLLPGGRFLHRTAPLEALLGADPEGLQLDGSAAGLGAASRRLRKLLERTGAPVHLIREGAVLRLASLSDAGAS